MTTNPIPVKAALEMLGLATARCGCRWCREPEERARSGRRSSGIGLVVAGARVVRPVERLSDGLAGSSRVLPLGGLGEIGKNMTVIEYDGRIVVVDTGLMFPTAEMLGIDLVLPDFSYLRDRADDIEAIVLTHGHEDHVGALPYVLREIGDAAGDLRRPADDRRWSARSSTSTSSATRRWRSCRPGRRCSSGRSSWSWSTSRTRSPTPARSSCTTELGSMLMTGDYKFDQTPVDGRPPTSRAWPSSAARAAAALRRLDQRRPARRRALGVERRAGAAGDRSRAARAGSSSPPSPPTSTASSR